MYFVIDGGEHMNIWAILGIEECRDQEKITAAYREKLIETNPEDKPEEFKKLRSAYEEALDWAKAVPEEEEEDHTPLGEWMSRVKDTYTSIAKRGDADCWKELLEDDVCVALDTGIEARNRLLGYLMESFRLPQPIWQLLNETFELEEQEEELKEHFPEDFVDFMLRECHEGTLLPLDLFQGDEYADYDQYISLLNKSTREINAREMEDAKKTLEDMRELGIYHPYHTINEIRVHLIGGEYDDAYRMASELYDIYPDDPEVTIYMGEALNVRDEAEEALRYYEKALEKEPKNFLARYGKAECYKKLKKYEESKDQYIAMIEDFPYNNAIRAALEDVNQLVIEDYKAKIAEDPKDVSTRLELGWSYLQNRQIDEGIALLDIVPDAENCCFYENLSGRLYLEKEDGEKALTHFQNWEGMIRELQGQENLPEKLEKEQKRLELPIYLQGYALAAMGKEEEALRKVEESLAIKVTEEALNYKAYLLYKAERYEEAIEACNELEKIAPELIGVFANRGRSLYELGYYQAAFEDFDRWLDLYAYDLEPYIYKIRILTYYEQYDRAKEILDYLESQKVESDRLRVCRARVMEETGNGADKNAAYELYREAVQNYEKGESDLDNIHQVYYFMAVLDENERPLKELLNEIDKGLSYKKDYLPLLNYKAYLLNKNKRREEALAVYEEVLRIDPGNRAANGRMGDIYYDMHQYEKALNCYERQLETDNSLNALIDKGRALIELERLDEALAACNAALKMDPEEACLYHNSGLIYLYQGKYPEAVQCYERALEQYGKKEEVSENTMEQMASCLIRMGNWQRAIEVYSRGKELSGKNYFTLNISDLYKFLGDYNKALEVLEQWAGAVDMEKAKNTYYHKKILLLLLAGDRKKGFKLCEKMKNQSFRIDELLSDYYIEKKKYGKVRELINFWIGQNREESDIYKWAAIRCAWMKDMGQARKYAEEGMNILRKETLRVENKVVNYLTAAVFNSILGRFNDAFFCIDRAKASVLCTNCKYCFCKDAEQELAFAYEMMGNRQEALRLYRNCLSHCRDDFDLVFRMERLEKC